MRLRCTICHALDPIFSDENEEEGMEQHCETNEQVSEDEDNVDL